MSEHEPTGARASAVARAADLLHGSGALDLWRRGASQLDRWLKALRVAPFAQRGGLVFMFHRLTERDDPIHLGSSVTLFERFCQHLAERYEVLPLVELERRRRSSQGLPAGAVALTFDDGYADNLKLGLPILRRYGLPATVFVTTGAIGGRAPLWTSRLACLVERGRLPEGPPLTLCGVTVRLGDDAEREAAFYELGEALKARDAVEREETIERLREALGVADYQCIADQMLTWDQVRECDAAGLTAGGHTVTHPILSRLDDAGVVEEILGCQEELEGQLGRKVLTFAYPNGEEQDYDQRCIDACRKGGYLAAYTTIFGANTPRTEPFEQLRVSAYGGNVAHLALQTERFFYTH